MASLRKYPRSKYFYACFTLADGRRVQRSTKETVRKAAQKIADEWERLGKERAKATQSHKVISDIFRMVHQSELPDSTVRSFLNGWLDRRQGELATSSHVAYKGAAERFIDWLGDRADRSLAELESSHFIGFRDAEAKRVAPATVNKNIKYLRVIFEDACRGGYIAQNPVASGKCPRLKVASKSAANQRRPFTVDELRAILALADEEMKSLILFGLYTGQRLGDLARLTWANLDLVAQEIHLTTSKTGRVVRIPICEPLMEHIRRLPAADRPGAFIHERASSGASTTNSTRFGDLLAAAGLVEPRTHGSRTGAGRDTKRGPSQLCFHSLRYTATSMMKNAGISPAVVQDIIGHQSAEISAHYTHIEREAKAKALAALPDLVR
jgi:integrase